MPQSVHCNICNKDYTNLKQHLAHSHNIGVVWFKCEQPKCTKQFKTQGDLNRHLADIHDIGVKWHICDQPKCKSKFKQQGHLNHHLADIHDIGVILHKCPQTGCTYESKRKGSLTAHLRGKHDIGNHLCAYCLEHHYSSIVIKDPLGAHHVCKTCFRTATGHSSRVEKDWSEYIDQHFGTNYLLSSDQNMRSLGGCSLYRPDKLYVSPDIVLMLECDEHQHKGTMYSCEQKRISDLFDEFEGRKLVVIRWNPDKYRGGSESRAVRMKACVALMRSVLARPPQEPIHVFYMFYDPEDNESLVQDLPKTFV